MESFLEFVKNIPTPITMLLFVVSIAAFCSALYEKRKLNITLGIIFMIAFIGAVLIKDKGDLIYLILCIAGMVLGIVEIMFPGIQLFGAIGAVLMGIGIYGTLDNIAYAMIGLFLTVLICFFIIKDNIKKGNHILGSEKLVLKNTLTDEEGFLAVDHPNLVGKIAITATPLRPSGYGIIDGERYDLYSLEGYIPQDVEVEVIKVESMKICVRRK